MSNPVAPPTRRNSHRWIFPVAFLLVAGLAIGMWLLLRPAAAVKPDAVAAAHANARGIGHMEQFKYVDAVKEFEEAMKFAPEWTPAKINLGIALLNTQEPEKLDRALKLFAEIIAVDRDNAHAHFCLGIILFHQDKLPEAAKHFDEVNRIDPNDAHAWYWRGRCILDSSTSEESLTLYQKALKL